MSAFMDTLVAGKIKVTSITRLQNISMWQSYAVKRQSIIQREFNIEVCLDAQPCWGRPAGGAPGFFRQSCGVAQFWRPPVLVSPNFGVAQFWCRPIAVSPNCGVAQFWCRPILMSCQLSHTPNLLVWRGLRGRS